MPAGISANSVAATSGGVCSGGSTITCTWPSLLAGATANVTIQATVPSNYASNTATNTATVSMANQSDTNPANNSASATITIARDADLAVTKQCKPDDPAAAGTNGTCQIFVDNLGPSTAAGRRPDGRARGQRAVLGEQRDPIDRQLRADLDPVRSSA